MSKLTTLLTFAASLALPGAGEARTPPPPADEVRLPAPPATVPAFCAPVEGPEYYAIELYTTKNLPGSGYARGMAEVFVSGASPFSVAVAPDGSYRYEVDIQLERVRSPARGHLVAWVTTPDIDRIRRIGTLDENLSARGAVDWNQFLVVVTWEPSDDPTAESWSGPVAFRGMSRSGMMHTMVGHGAFQEENCAAYGYGN